MATESVRRTPEEVAAEYQRRAEAAKARAKLAEAKARPEWRAFLDAWGSLQRAQDAAVAAQDMGMTETLTAASGVLAEHANQRGIVPPRRRGQGGVKE